MNRFWTGILAGIVLVVAGLLLSPEYLIQALHGPVSGVLQEQLHLGAQLFRTVLAVSGLYFILLASLPSPRAVVVSAVSAPVPARSLAVLSAIVIAATLLRVFRLDSGIWLDEMLTFVNYMPMTAGRIMTTFDDANNHLLFTLLARLSFDLFGAHTWSLRLPALLFGIGSIPALYWFARQVGSEREALLSAALFAFSYHHVWFSQNARGYTALLCMTLLSSTFLLRALRDNRTGNWLWYAVTAALGVFTHLTMGFVIVGQFLVYIGYLLHTGNGRSSAGWHGLLAGFIPAGLLSLLCYALVLPQMAGGGLASGAQGTVTEWTNPVWMVLEIVRGLQIGFAGGLVALAAGLVFLVGVVDYLRKAPLVPALLFIPSLLGFLVMVSIGYTLFPRFFFFAMGFGVLVVIRGTLLTGDALGRLLRLPGAVGSRAGSLLCTGLVAVSLLSLKHVYGPKQDYVGARELIEQQGRAGDAVVTVGIASFAYGRFYQTGWESVTTLQELNAVRSTADRTWVVYTMPLHTAAAYPELYDVIRREFTRVGKFYGTLSGGSVVVCLATRD